MNEQEITEAFQKLASTYGLIYKSPQPGEHRLTRHDGADVGGFDIQAMRSKGFDDALIEFAVRMVIANIDSIESNKLGMQLLGVC